MDAIILKAVEKSYPTGHIIQKRYRALRGVSMKVGMGETFGLLGHNGAGKTTIFKILNGLIRPDRGEALIFGEPAGSLKARARVGFLPENPYFYTYLTPLELLFFYGELSGLNRREIEERVNHLIRLVGLEKWRNTPIKKFSKGMLQRVGMAQALISDPDLLILDEPMTGLDPVGRKELKELILKLKGQGKTIIFSSHILSDVERICDRVAILIKGRIVEEGDLRELLLNRTTGYEIEFSATSLQWLRERGLRYSGGGSTVSVEFKTREEAEETLRQALLAGVEVISYMPRRIQLEDLFMEEYLKHEQN